ncbi:MAG: aspartate/glutamate racemase family protein [Bacilli bacterium]
MKTAGILAGLGPLAGAYFYRRLIELTPGSDDQDHIPVVLVSDPLIPSRLLHLEGAGTSPVPKLLEAIQKLVAAGADFIAIPSSTTNIFYPDLVDAIDVPIISLIKEVTAGIAKTHCKTIGVLGTTPTQSYGIYDRSFAQAGLRAVYPDAASQSEIMALIARVKGGTAGTPLERPLSESSLSERLYEVACRPWSQGIDGLLLACTEIPVIFPTETWFSSRGAEPRLFSSTDMLAESVIMAATAP